MRASKNDKFHGFAHEQYFVRTIDESLSGAI